MLTSSPSVLKLFSGLVCFVVRKTARSATSPFSVRRAHETSSADNTALPPKLVEVEMLEFNDEERAICEFSCLLAFCNRSLLLRQCGFVLSDSQRY
jgi:hypothetical protein